MKFYLVTYHPLCVNRAGRAAAAKHGHPLFIDASCRREPDFQAEPPSISAICRGANFAPRLKGGDVVAYATVLNRYPGNSDPAWRLVAVLQVARSFDSHVEAAEWYLRKGLPLPSNCLVEGNTPFGIDHTARPDENLEEWDARYQARVVQHGKFHLCEPLFLELDEPPVLTTEHMRRALGTERPPSRNPKAWPRAHIESLLRSVGITIEPLSLLDLVSKTDVSHLAPIKPARGPPATHRASAGGCGEPARARRRGGC
jgi:hypothetical protein